jgi:hypothetical protein
MGGTPRGIRRPPDEGGDVRVRRACQHGPCPFTSSSNGCFIFINLVDDGTVQNVRSVVPVGGLFNQSVENSEGVA